jgi:hypothetical protein
VNTTTITITDPELLAKLVAAEGQIVFCGPSGDTVKTVETIPIPLGTLPLGTRSPFTDEEIEAARNEPDCEITLSEFWKKVQSGGWK